MAKPKKITSFTIETSQGTTAQVPASIGDLYLDKLEINDGLPEVTLADGTNYEISIISPFSSFSREYFVKTAEITGLHKTYCFEFDENDLECVIVNNGNDGNPITLEVTDKNGGKRILMGVEK